MEQNYFLGLDMGTGSLGWAVTNDKYEVLRRHGKALWGVRLFESANTAEERRGFRTARRRLDRRNWRLQILQELFAEEIAKVDPGFYLRMKESKYYPEDKRGLSGECPELPYALFVDKNFTDKDYHQQFPTIYHLRKKYFSPINYPNRIDSFLAVFKIKTIREAMTPPISLFVPHVDRHDLLAKFRRTHIYILLIYKWTRNSMAN